jgi:hypothetical protein
MSPISSNGKRKWYAQRIHGNWCGPGWSGGKWQDSVSDDTPAIDDFDLSCKRHDSRYASGGNLKSADFDFFKENIGKGPLRTLAAVSVGFQGLFREDSKVGEFVF